MKRVIVISFVLFGLLVLGGNVLPLGRSGASAMVDSAVVEFTETVRLREVLLRGQYLVVHDEEKMFRGLPCTYVYRGKERIDDNLVTAFHCIHAERQQVSSFKVTFARRVTPSGVAEIAEIQFAGSKDGHIVP